MASSAGEYDEFLISWLQHDKKLITYRLLSRELRIHVAEAKQTLADFYNKRKGKGDVAATYILIGTPAAAAAHESPVHEENQPSSSTASSSRPNSLNFRVSSRQTVLDAPRQIIKLVAADDLQAAKKDLDTVTSCHIYSLSPGVLRDPAQLTAVQHDLHTKKKYVTAWEETGRGVQLGVIANPHIKDNYDPSKSLPSLAAPSGPALAKKSDEESAEQRKKDDTKQEKTERATKMAEVKNESDSKQNPTKKSGLDWSRSKFKASEPSPATNAKSDVKATANSTKKAAGLRKALMGSDDDEEVADMYQEHDDEDDEDDAKPEKLGYADDDAMSKIRPAGNGRRADAKSSSKAERDAQRKELEAMMDSDDAADADPELSPAPEPVTAMMQGNNETATATSDEPPKRVRKKRKIGTKKVRSKDERGYTKVREESEYESYSSDDSSVPTGAKRAAPQKTAPKTAPLSTSNPASESPALPASKNNTPAPSSIAPKKAPAASGPPKKGQQNLNSFFMRKPKDK